MKKSIIIAVTFALFYSIVRYNVFGNMPLSDIPLFIANKAIAFSMIIILTIAFFKYNSKNKDECLLYIDVFKLFSVIHVLITISLLSQNYYPKLYLDNKLTLFGSLAILAGILSFTYMIDKKFKIKLILLYSLVAVHVLFLGAKGWFAVEKWNGMTPPITLICFLIILILVILSALIDENKELRKY